MTVENFVCLSELEKINVLIVEGSTIGETKSDSERVFLYKVDSFYVTVSFDARTDELISIQPFAACVKKGYPQKVYGVWRTADPQQRTLN